MALLLKCLLLLLPFILAGCGGEPAGPEEKGRGYRRIISLGPTITQNIYLLGREDLLVGVSSYCRYLPEVADVEIAGDLVNANVEKVLSLSPDAVLVTGMAGRGSVEKMRSLGLNVVFFPEPSNFEEICSQFEELGRLTGQDEKASEIISRVRAEAGSLRNKSAGYAPEKVLAQIGADPLWVSPKSSFINDIIEFAGGINAGPGDGGMVNIESVISSNPDVILIIDMGIAEEQKRMWENYPVLNAVKNDRIYLVDSYLYCSPTPEIFLEAVRRTFEILHER